MKSARSVSSPGNDKVIGASPLVSNGGAVPTGFTVWLTDLRGNPFRRTKLSLTKFNCDPLSIKAR